MFYNLHGRPPSAARVATCASSAVDAFKDALNAGRWGERREAAARNRADMNVEEVGRHLVARRGGERRGSTRRGAWCGDAAPESAVGMAFATRLGEEARPLMQTLFLDGCGPSATVRCCAVDSGPSLPRLSEHLSRAHAAAGFVAGALRKVSAARRRARGVVAGEGETPTAQGARRVHAQGRRDSRRRCAPLAHRGGFFHTFAHASPGCGELFRRW